MGRKERTSAAETPLVGGAMPASSGYDLELGAGAGAGTSGGGRNYAYGDEERMCRICLDTAPEGLIAPCTCRGSQKWVHRSCLDRWRVTRTGNAFEQCHECLFTYRVKCEGMEEKEILKRARLMVARDSIIVLLGFQTAIILTSMLCWVFDKYCFDYQIRFKLFPTWLAENHRVTVYYIQGAVLFFAILGLIYAVSACLVCSCSGQTQSAHVGCYDDYLCCWLCWVQTPSGGSGSTCDCKGCGDMKCNDCGNCDGDAAGVLGAILLIALVFFFVIGLVVTVMLLVMVLQKGLQRYVDVMRKRHLVRQLVVMDLDGMSPEEILRMVEIAPAASAPPMPASNPPQNEMKVPGAAPRKSSV